MHLIGLTGGICCGKSYVLKILSGLGCYCLRADDLAKEILYHKVDRKLLTKIKNLFGADLLVKDQLDQQRMAQLIFNDPEKRLQLNALVHPLVAARRREKIKEIAATNHYQFFIYESALLIEARTFREFEKLIVVYCSYQEQLGRLMERDHLTLEEAEKKIQTQIPLRQKLRYADYVIDTSGDFEKTKANTLEVFALIRGEFNVY